MDLPPAIPLLKGKREAEDAVAVEVVSSKKQKVGENVSGSEIEIENQTDAIELEKNVLTSSETADFCSKPDQLIKDKVSGEDEYVVAVLEDKTNSLEEDTGAANENPMCTEKEGHIVATPVIDESNETKLNADVAATTPAPLIEEDLAVLSKKKDDSREDYDCFSKRETILDEDVTAANLAPPAPSTDKSSISLQTNDDARTREFDSTHEVNFDDNADHPANVAPPAPTETGSVVSLSKDDDSCSNDERFDKIERTYSNLTKEEDKTNAELELDDETSSSDEDQQQTPATPTDHQTTGGKTLFVGNLSFSIEQEDVEDFFKSAGEVVDIRFAMNPDETFKGYGYVKFSSAEAAEKALLDLNGKELLRRRVKLDIVKERGLFIPYTGQDTESFQKAGKAQGQTVFVRGFNKSDCQDEIKKYLEEHFGSCGEISRVSVPKDQDGCARGIAYIDFKDRDAFTQALALNGSEFRECILSVKEAISRGDNHDSAGSGRGYGRNGERCGRWEFGGRSSWRDFNGSGVRGTGAWFGAGVWRTSSGRGVWQNSGGRGDCQNSSGRGDWQNSGGRGEWQNSSGRGDWHNSNGSGRGGWHNSNGSGRGGWHNSNGSGRGGWQNSNSSGRGVWQNTNSSGRGDWHNSNSSGRGNWQNSSGRDVWQNSNSTGRGDWQNSNSSGRGDCQNSNFSGRGDWHNSNSNGRGDWQNSSGRGVWQNSNSTGSGRGVWQNSNSTGRGVWQNSNSSGRGDWQNSNFSGRGSWHNSNFNGRGDWQNSSGRGVWQNSRGRGVRRDYSGTGVWFGEGSRGQGTPIEPSIAAPGAGNNSTSNNEG